MHVKIEEEVEKIAFIQFDLSSILPGSSIVSTVLFIYDKSGRDFPIDIHRVTQAWDDDTVTWETAPTYDPGVMGSLQLSGEKCAHGAYLNLAVISDWVNNPGGNFGLLLYPPSGKDDAAITSMEGSRPPKLVIEFMPPGSQTLNLLDTSTTKPLGDSVIISQLDRFERFLSQLRKFSVPWLP